MQIQLTNHILSTNENEGQLFCVTGTRMKMKEVKKKTKKKTRQIPFYCTDVYLFNWKENKWNIKTIPELKWNCVE